MSKFIEHVDKDPNFPDEIYTNRYWISEDNNLKIQLYNSEFAHYAQALKFKPRPSGYYAAYHAVGRPGTFGDHVDRSTPFYRTLREAKKACEHYTKRCD